MPDLAVVGNRIPAMSTTAIEKVRSFEAFLLKAPQVEIPTSHTLHGGIYTRTIMLPAKVALTGAVIKIATTLIISGDVVVYIGDQAKELHGYNVLLASANRKQAFRALTDTDMTMFFATKAKTVAEAEAEFTDDAHLLFSRYPSAINNITITGE